jgi:hypothetical protein
MWKRPRRRKLGDCERRYGNASPRFLHTERKNGAGGVGGRPPRRIGRAALPALAEHKIFETGAATQPGCPVALEGNRSSQLVKKLLESDCEAIALLTCANYLLIRCGSSTGQQILQRFDIGLLHLGFRRVDS